MIWVRSWICHGSSPSRLTLHSFHTILWMRPSWRTSVPRLTPPFLVLMAPCRLRLLSLKFFHHGLPPVRKPYVFFMYCYKCDPAERWDFQGLYDPGIAYSTPLVATYGYKVLSPSVVAQSRDSWCFSRPTMGATLPKDRFFRVCLLIAHGTLRVTPHRCEVCSTVGHRSVERFYVIFMPYYGCDPPEGKIFQCLCQDIWCALHFAGDASWVQSSICNGLLPNRETLHLFHILLRIQLSKRMNFSRLMPPCLIQVALCGWPHMGESSPCHGFFLIDRLFVFFTL